MKQREASCPAQHALQTQQHLPSHIATAGARNQKTTLYEDDTIVGAREDFGAAVPKLSV